MHHSCNQFLAGAGLPAEKHGGIGVRHLADIIEHAQKRPAAADNLAATGNIFEVFLEQFANPFIT